MALLRFGVSLSFGLAGLHELIVFWDCLASGGSVSAPLLLDCGLIAEGLGVLVYVGGYTAELPLDLSVLSMVSYCGLCTLGF